jgi:hypothetical protein
MPRNISFALTAAQFLDGSKDVTRRMGWKHLKAGDILCAVEKSQGLKKGETVNKLGMIRVVSVRREKLDQISRFALSYGRDECRREGFPKISPGDFVEFFCA